MIDASATERSEGAGAEGGVDHNASATERSEGAGAEGGVDHNASATERSEGAGAMEVPSEAVLEIKPGRYQHYKNLPYRVIGTARHSETMELLVVYQSLYETNGVDPATRTTGMLWVRPAAMFAETVSFQGQIVPRFQRIGD